MSPLKLCARRSPATLAGSITSCRKKSGPRGSACSPAWSPTQGSRARCSASASRRVTSPVDTLRWDLQGDVTSSTTAGRAGRLDSNALKRLQEIKNDHPCDRRLPRRSHGAFKQRIVALDQGRAATSTRIQERRSRLRLRVLPRASRAGRLGKRGTIFVRASGRRHGTQ